MHEPKFYHEVLGPTITLLSRASENVCVEPEFSDVVSLAKQAAIAAYHFREAALRGAGNDVVPPMRHPSAENLRKRLQDVADSAKHGPLKVADRDVTLNSALAFELDPGKGFRFLRTEVLAASKRWGEFELSDVIQEYLQHLTAELDINLDIKIALPTYPFLEWAETYFTPKSGFKIGKLRLLTYIRNKENRLIRADVPEVKFRIVQL